MITWVLVIPPPKAVTVTDGVPRAAADEAAIVSELLPFPGAAMPAGAKLAVTPLGSPVTDNATAELNPLATAVVSTIRVDPLRATLALVTLDERLNAGVRMLRPKV